MLTINIQNLKMKVAITAFEAYFYCSNTSHFIETGFLLTGCYKARWLEGHGIVTFQYDMKQRYQSINKLGCKFILCEIIMMTSSCLSVFWRYNVNEFISCFIHKWIEIWNFNMLFLKLLAVCLLYGMFYTSWLFINLVSIHFFESYIIIRV